MTRMKRILGAIALAVLVMTLPACGGMRDAAARQKKANDIKQFLLAYHNFLDINTKPPANQAEFTAHVAKSDPDAGAAVSRVLSQGYFVYWGTNPTKLTTGSSNTVLVYPGDAATNGGLVGLADGSTRMMTAAEFDAAAKPPAPKK